MSPKLLLGVLLWCKSAFGVVQPTTNLVDGKCADGYDPEVHGSIDFFPYQSTGGSAFKGKASADFSLLWDVSYHGTYKLLVNHLREETYVLWQCGTERPEIEGAAAYFEVPVSRVATTSTTYMPYIEIIGERTKMVAYTSTFDWVSSPCLQRLHRDGYIREAFNASTGAFTLKDDEVDVTIADEWTVDRVPKGYSITDTHEDTVFQVAEYVEVVGLFFNREHEATLAVERILNAYNCLKDQIVVQTPKKAVLAGYVASADAFSIAACPAWYCEVVRDAGGEIIEFKGEGAVEMWGYKFMSLEQLLVLAADADVYISDAPLPDPGHNTTDTLLAELGIPVFDSQGPLGYNDWWERRLAEPEAVLSDFAAIFWPETYGATRNFFRDISAGEPAGSMVPDDALDAACPNPDAPYHYLLSAAADCLANQQRKADAASKSGSKNKKSSSKASTTLIIILAVLLGVFALALVALLFYSQRKSACVAATTFKADAIELASHKDDIFEQDQKTEKDENTVGNPAFT